MLRSLLVKFYRSSKPINGVAANIYDYLGNIFKLSAMTIRRNAPRIERLADEIETLGIKEAFSRMFDRCMEDAEDDHEHFMFVLYDLQQIGKEE